MVELSFSLIDFEYMLLILVRIASFMFVAPFFGQNGVPAPAKIGLSFFITIILYEVVPDPTLDYVSEIGYGIAVLKEAITGLLIGFAANICSSIVIFAGNIIDMDIGLSMATTFNPDMSLQTTVTGNLYYYMIFAFMIASNTHLYVLRAIADSFYVVPIAGAAFEWDSLLVTMTKYMTDLFVIGFRIFLPFFATMMIMNCILGIMAKVAPQMNMFSVGIQLKILVGYIVLFLTIFMFPSVAEYVFDEIKTMVVLIIEGMY
ncbi:MAG: flagellar biosynthetic protein FliR [Agathobacter sp.]|nr:flagellar biosynthetic protein FliR [Agathobacter sp.]